MRNTRKLMSASLVALLLMSLTLSLISYAQVPQIPMTVHGIVYIDTDPAPAGMNVYAKDGTTIINQCVTTATGTYALSIEGPDEGTSIDLWVETTNVETITLSYMAILELDLTITGVTGDTGTLSITTTPVTGEVSVGGVSWGDAPASDVVDVGSYTVSFGAVSGYTTPADQVAAVTADATTNIVGTYVVIPGETGTLSIVTTPVMGVVSVDGTSWGTAPQSNVVAIGSYTVSFGAVSDYTTPADQVAAVTADATTTITGTYVEITDIITPTADFSIDDVSADTGDKGDTLTVTGSGVTAGTTVNLYWDYASGSGIHLLNATEGDPDGTFELEIDVPSDTVGPHYLWATDVSTGETVSWGPFTMVPKISLSPSSGLVDDEITIKGYGYTAEANMTFKIGTANLTVSPSDAETDEDGYFTVTFDVPDNVYDTYSITVTDFYGKTDSADFILGASITLTPDEGPTGAVVVVEGRGWTEDANITFTLGGTTVQVVDDDVVTVDDDGEFSVDVVIPDMGTEDDYDLEATESGGLKGPADEEFEVNGVPEVEVTPTYGAPGATITITGSNFTQIAETEVTITLDSSPVSSLVTAETEADGTFTATFTSPASVLP